MARLWLTLLTLNAGSSAMALTPGQPLRLVHGLTLPPGAAGRSACGAVHRQPVIASESEGGVDTGIGATALVWVNPSLSKLHLALNEAVVSCRPESTPLQWAEANKLWFGVATLLPYKTGSASWLKKRAGQGISSRTPHLSGTPRCYTMAGACARILHLGSKPMPRRCTPSPSTL